jgi:hypothetical protein
MRFKRNNSFGDIVPGGNEPGTTKTKLFSLHAVYYDSLSNSLLIANFDGNHMVRWLLGANNYTLAAGSNTGAFVDNIDIVVCRELWACPDPGPGLHFLFFSGPGPAPKIFCRTQVHL